MSQYPDIGSHAYPSCSIRVCLVAPVPPPYGGISHWTSMMVAYISGIDDVDLVVVNTAPRWRSIHNNGLHYRVLGGSIQLVRDIGRLFQALIFGNFDAVHLTTSGHLSVLRDFFLSYLIVFFGIRFIYHIRFGRIPLISKANSIEWSILLRVMRRASTVILIDQATFSAVCELAPDVNAVLIPNFVIVDELTPPIQILPELKTALFVGWVIPAKGISELVEAWSILKPKNWRLEIIGPGDKSYQSELIRKFQPQNLDFAGELSHAHVKARLSQCDLFVFPSHTEGFPNAVLEAMACGKPILATSVGGIPEMLDGNCGLTIQPRDVTSLTTALEYMCLNSDLRVEMGRRARAQALSNYSVEIILAKYLTHWRPGSIITS